MPSDAVLQRPVTTARPAVAKVACRPIEQGDLPAVINLLQTAFGSRNPGFWQDGLRRLAQRTAPFGFPQFGDMLTVDGEPAGVHLLVTAPRLDDSAAPVRCNGSSWCVDERFQSYGIFLLMRGTKRQPAVYTDIGPRPHTVPMITAQGYRLYSRGIFACVPALARAPTARTRLLTDQVAWQASNVPASDQRMLVDHLAFGCICIWCEGASGGQPVIVRRRYVKPGIPCAQLIYCRSIAAFSDVARPVGRFLARRGMPLLLVPADQPIAGVPGRLFPDRLPMYFKGAQAPNPTDLSYTEVAVFGL